MEQGEKLALELQSLFDLQIELPEACREAEARIADGISEVIEEVIGASKQPGEGSSILHDGIRFEVRAREIAGDASTLVVAIGETATHWNAAAFAQVPITLSGSGMYTTVTVEADERLKESLDQIATALQQYLQGGYRRMETHVVAELLKVEHRLAVDLYAEVRGPLEESAASHVGLYCLLPNGQATYLLDPLAIQIALSRLESQRPTTSASPLALATILVKGWVKSEDTIAERALVASQPLGFRSQDLSYTTTPGFDVAEGSLYERADLICQPLVPNAPVRLIAAYPIEMRDAVEKELDRLSPRFADTLAKHAVTTKKLVRSRPDSGWWNADRLAELLGRFAGGFTDSLQ